MCDSAQSTQSKNNTKHFKVVCIQFSQNFTKFGTNLSVTTPLDLVCGDISVYNKV